MIEPGVIRRVSTRLPYSILIPLGCIIFIGILNLASAARATRPDLYLSQFSKFGFGFFLMTLTALVHTRVWRRLAYLIFSCSLILLVLVLLVGASAKGAQRWLVIGAFRLQPSDPAKIALILALARYCSLYWPAQGYTLAALFRPLNITRPIGFLLAIIGLLVKERHGDRLLSNEFLGSASGIILMSGLLLVGIVWLIISGVKLYESNFHLTRLIAPVDIAITPFILMYLEPDLGTGLLVLGIAAIIFLFVGVKFHSIFSGIIILILISVGSYFTLLKNYQKQRLISFFDQNSDIHGQGYQAMQSIIAIGSGQFTGKGYRGGTQTQLSFLPENSTDFVFSVWAEEWGFLASFFVLSLYFILITGILFLITRVEDKFSQLICIGVAANLFLHVIINIGMVTGLLPVVGMPLPLMSYGGSSMAITMISIGLCLNVAFWRGAQ